MGNIVLVDDLNFETEVFKSELPVLVDFGADWCAPCQRLYSTVAKFAADNDGKIKVCKVDIDDAPNITAKLGIRGVPTLVVFNGGNSLGHKVGLISLTEMSSFVMAEIAGYILAAAQYIKL